MGVIKKEIKSKEIKKNKTDSSKIEIVIRMFITAG